MQQDFLKELENLTIMKKAGLLSEAAFAAHKQQLMKRMETGYSPARPAPIEEAYDELKGPWLSFGKALSFGFSIHNFVVTFGLCLLFVVFSFIIASLK